MNDLADEMAQTKHMGCSTLCVAGRCVREGKEGMWECVRCVGAQAHLHSCFRAMEHASLKSLRRCPARVQCHHRVRAPSALATALCPHRPLYPQLSMRHARRLTCSHMSHFLTHHTFSHMSISLTHTMCGSTTLDRCIICTCRLSPLEEVQPQRLEAVALSVGRQDMPGGLLTHTRHTFSP